MPLDLGVLQLGFFVVFTLVNFVREEGDRGVLGASVLWPISDACGLRYQIGLSSRVNLHDAGLASSLSFDLALF